MLIVGGGPAGSSCARELMKAGMDVCILEKEPFPRSKPCAGWITPEVFTDLGVDPADYPYPLGALNRLNIHIFGVRLPLPTRQYSVRRYEFDAWLINLSAAPVRTHRVRTIRFLDSHYLIDDAYRCRYLVGAGGTCCPVYESLFSALRPRDGESRIVALYEEFPCETPHREGSLWFFDHGLPGYAWFLPKAGGYLNVGIGGKHLGMKRKGRTIRSHWEAFTRKLEEGFLLTGHPYSPRGHWYYIRNDTGPTRLGNAFVIGDAAGLATRDMGEGIGPAVRSGILAAREIIGKRPTATRGISRFSLPGILLPDRGRPW